MKNRYYIQLLFPRIRKQQISNIYLRNIVWDNLLFRNVGPITCLGLIFSKPLNKNISRHNIYLSSSEIYLKPFWENSKGVYLLQLHNVNMKKNVMCFVSFIRENFCVLTFSAHFNHKILFDNKELLQIMRMFNYYRCIICMSGKDIKSIILLWKCE